MHEHEEKLIPQTDDISKRPSDKPPSKFKTWLENYWYHYKFHTLIAIALIFCVTVCAVQCSQRQSSDAYIMYAGPYDIKQGELQDMKSTLKSYVEDYNDDGEKVISISSLFLMTQEQIAERNNVGDGYEVNTRLIVDNMEIYKQQLQIGEYCIFLLDEVWFYDIYADGSDKNAFAKISELVPESRNTDELEFVNDYGIRLSSLPIYGEPGFCNLPADTVLAIRISSSMDSGFGSNTENHDNHVDVIKKILS